MGQATAWRGVPAHARRAAIAALPGGTVTFFFTDVEESTRLWEEQPNAMRAALQRHDTLLSAGIEGYGGVVVKSRGEGDSFFAVFTRASDAVAAAGVLQLALSAERWPTSRPLRIRMALHTGEAELRQDDYYGTAVNRCARLRGAGHGGQVLLSSLTAELVRDTLPLGASLLDLGEHRLRDLVRPERIFQLAHPDLPSNFPPLASLEVRPNNLPRQSTPLIGRDQDAADAAALLLREDIRLLTISGPGGAGKTRLGLRVATDLLDRFEHGVFFVALASINNQDLVPSTILQSLGLSEPAGRLPIESLEAFLRDRQLLLLLDNFEQVIAAAPLVGQLLLACPRLKMIVTSRAVLHLKGEHEFPVPPLALPDPERLPPIEALSQYASVALFIERALAVKPDFAVTNENAPALAEICHRLDGLPLAIELAAARIRVMPPRAMLARLTGGAGPALQLLTGGALDLPTRHQTLRATIAWSYELLSPSEQRIFRCLAVFVGGCPLEAVEALADSPDALEALSSLVDKSLLRQVESAGTEPRFTLLATIREFALEQLTANAEEAEARRRHAEYFETLARQAEPLIKGADQEEWLARLELEHDNLRAALAWSVSPTSPTETDRAGLGLRLASALAWFWYVHSHLREGRRWFSEVLTANPAADPLWRARALQGAGLLAENQAAYDEADALLEQSLALAQELDDRPTIAWSLCLLGLVTRNRGQYRRATALFDQSLAIFRDLGERWHTQVVLLWLGSVARYQDDFDRATALLNESLALGRELGDRNMVARALGHLGGMAHAQGQDAVAIAQTEESLVLYRQINSKWGIAVALASLGDLARAHGDAGRADDLNRKSLALFRDLGDRWGIARALHNLGRVAELKARHSRAARLYLASDVVRAAIGAPPRFSDRAEYEDDLAAVRARLGEDAFAAACAAAQALSIDQSVAYGLDPTAGD